MMLARGGTTEQGRAYRQKGHDDALLFAQHLELDSDYQRDPQAKKDVIDPSGDSHSVKSGEKKWQVFLYRKSRFETDYGFRALNGIGELLIRCIDSFPPTFEDYQRDKISSKQRLRVPMIELKNRFQRRDLSEAFLMKSIFNGGEVNYLTIYDKKVFHVYWNSEVVRVMGNNFTVENSTSKGGNPDCQKVLFKYNNKNVGELEMRNDSPQHYREVRFNMLKLPCCELLASQILNSHRYWDKPIISYGEAISKFWKW